MDITLACDLSFYCVFLNNGNNKNPLHYVGKYCLFIFCARSGMLQIGVVLDCFFYIEFKIKNKIKPLLPLTYKIFHQLSHSLVVGYPWPFPLKDTEGGKVLDLTIHPDFLSDRSKKAIDYWLWLIDPLLLINLSTTYWLMKFTRQKYK